jgi:hypothetical protein
MRFSSVKILEKKSTFLKMRGRKREGGERSEGEKREKRGERRRGKEREGREGKGEGGKRRTPENLQVLKLFLGAGYIFLSERRCYLFPVCSLALMTWYVFFFSALPHHVVPFCPLVLSPLAQSSFLPPVFLLLSTLLPPFFLLHPLLPLLNPQQKHVSLTDNSMFDISENTLTILPNILSKSLLHLTYEFFFVKLFFKLKFIIFSEFF